MGLDFHLAENAYESQHNTPTFSLELKPHSFIFSRITDSKMNVPLFKRVENYYKDAEYGHQELLNLAEEISLVTNLFYDNQHLNLLLCDFVKICRDAHEKGLSVWVYCD